MANDPNGGHHRPGMEGFIKALVTGMRENKRALGTAPVQKPKGKGK